MTKFYEVSKVLDKRTDAHGRVQFLVRWRAGGGGWQRGLEPSLHDRPS